LIDNEEEEASMRVFHTVVFDDTVEGTTAVYTGPQHNSILGFPDALSIYGYAAQAAGTSPTITVQVEHGPDERRWINRNGTAEVNAVSLNAATETPFSGNDLNPAGTTRLGFARLRVQIGGTGSPKARVKIWVTGRGEQASGG
jgi:hypothetical protein